MAAALGNNHNHNHVQKVSPHEWEDEAFNELADGIASDASNTEKGKKGKPLRQAAAALRSSFNALRMTSVTERPGSKANLGKAAGRDSSIVDSLASLGRGIANAVGLHRDGSPVRDVSPSESASCRSKLVTSQSRNLVRLSSAAMMRSELQNYSQFGDLRNDSFSSPSSTKLKRRSSLLPKGSDSSITVPTPPAGPRTSCHKAGSSDLSRQSTTGCTGPYAPCHRLTCPGELPSPFPTSSSPSPQPPPPLAADAAGGGVASPFNRHNRGSSLASEGGGASNACSAFSQAGSTPPSRAASGPAPPPPPSPSNTPMTVSSVHPHPPTQPQPHPPPQPRHGPINLSPAASRSVSTEHLPPMQSPGSLSASPSGIASAGGAGGGSTTSVRDRPPTPRGRTSASGSSPSKLAQVLGSFHLPEILVGGSGRSVTERRGSVSGDGSVSRARRNSVSGGPGGMGPGGAAISASIAKRTAAAAAAAGGLPSSPGGAASLAVSPSGASGTALPRPSGPSVTGRVGSVTGKAPGGILQDFQSSLELEEDNALAAVDAEFDRRFRQSNPDARAPIDATAPGPGFQQPTLHPQAPRSERTTPQGAPLRPNPLGDAGFGSGPVFRNPRRQSCSATLFGTADNMDDGAAAGGGAADAFLLASMDAVPSCSGGSANAKMRLASIRLSYAEGIVPGAASSSRRASLDIPSSPYTRTTPTAWPQSPGPASRPHLPGITAGVAGPSP